MYESSALKNAGKEFQRMKAAKRYCLAYFGIIKLSFKPYSG